MLVVGDLSLHYYEDHSQQTDYSHTSSDVELGVGITGHRNRYVLVSNRQGGLD